MRIISRATGALGRAYGQIKRSLVRIPGISGTVHGIVHSIATNKGLVKGRQASVRDLVSEKEKRELPEASRLLIVNPHIGFEEHSFRSSSIKNPHPDKEIDLSKGLKVIDKEDGTYLKIFYKDGTDAAVKAPPDLPIFVSQGSQFINRPDMLKGDDREVRKAENLALRGRIIMDKNDTVIGPQTRFGEPNNISSEYGRDPYFYFNGSESGAGASRGIQSGRTHRSEDTLMEKEWERYQAQNTARYDRSEIAAGRAWYKKQTFGLVLTDILFFPVDLAYFAGSRLFRAVASIYRSVTGFWKNPALELPMLKGYLRAVIRRFFNRNKPG